LHQNQPSRESIFCGKVGEWWRKRALFVLNFIPKTRQKGGVLLARAWATTTDSAYAYGRQYERLQGMLLTSTETESWKDGRNTPLAASFQLVEKGIECFPFGRGLRHNHFLPQTNGAGF